jgi:chromosome segregation protein
MHVKQLELTRFKSFGSTTVIPLLPGFTVVSGPNGSGKSNILDAILFALGLSSSRGMRADKLLDLVHAGSLSGSKKRIETSVSVIFALDDHGSSEWKVTRRLRVNPGKSHEASPGYTSTFYINDIPCPLTELHEQLEAMHVYPNGYNVVLQGDVTSIISMNPKERRQIIDELAGVATFDRKIAQANEKLEGVREQIERFRLIEQEWQSQRDRLLKESEKAQHYQQLRTELGQVELKHQVVTWRSIQEKYEQTEAAITNWIQQQTQAKEEMERIRVNLSQEEEKLTLLQNRIHSLGEEDYLQMQAQLVSYQTQQQQTQQQIRRWKEDYQAALQGIQQQQQQQADLEREKTQYEKHYQELTQQLKQLSQQQQQWQQQIQSSREQQQALAQSSDAWIKQQRYLLQQLEETRQEYTPQQQAFVRMTEQLHQWESREQELIQEIQIQESQKAAQSSSERETLQQTLHQTEKRIQDLAQRLSEVQSQQAIDQATQERLQTELYTKQRQLDKLETKRQVLQDTQGSRGIQVILAQQIPGVCGLVAQLGQVDPRYQVALEVAAGGRLNYLVVENDSVAVAVIQLLKRDNLGRATVLPLNKLQSSRPPTPLKLPGLIDYAIRLIQFDDRYRNVFGFVFGQTLVFQSLEEARPHIGRYRIVTLDGELLETSGAMTGGSLSKGSQLHFGATDNAEIDSLKHRLEDIQELLDVLRPRLQLAQTQEKQLTQDITTTRQIAAKLTQELDRQITEDLTRETRLQHLYNQQTHWQQEQATTREKLQHLTLILDPLQQRLEDLTAKLEHLKNSPVNQHWQQVQTTLQQQEAALAQVLKQQRDLETAQHTLLTQIQLNQAQCYSSQERIQDYQHRSEVLQTQITQHQIHAQDLDQQIQDLQLKMNAAEARLSHLRQERDTQEFQVRTTQQHLQRLEWDFYNAQSQQQEKETLLTQLKTQEAEAKANLPDLIPEISANVTLEDLHRQRRRLEDKMKALEPVNMLALQDYEDTETRLQQLTERLGTLQEERTELLLRIENFATLRKQAFLEAFSAVDQHFRSIFAQLSDGDGYLQLESPEDPLAGGLTLVAHPKGKPVRRLNAMSGGEKSLTALSFIFALQRYRPSSFYAFDEVDMFLDGANVDRLATMIWQQSRLAQFIVVSLRRPMIEKAERTIGVTQARGAFTQVIGVKNRLAT